MKQIPLGKSQLQVPPIAVGCMRLTDLTTIEAEAFLRSAIDMGLTFFDHADIYGGGRCEEIFAQALPKSEDMREKLILQSKCGIVPGVSYNFSKGHIIESVNSSLRRLKTDYLDVLLLHRPDTLVDPEEVADAFTALQESGKVKHFGVSNQNPMQIKLLQKYLSQPIVANQLQFGIAHAHIISNGMHVNMQDDASINRDGSILDFCRLEDITIQAWSPFQYGFFEGVFLGSDKFPKLNRVIDEIAEKHKVTNTAVAIAWILRHPAKMQAITGTTNKKRLADIDKATTFTLTHEEWYAIFMAAGNNLP